VVSAEALAARFEEHRPHLRAVAYRMLGSLSDADDAVQETWLRLSRSDADAVENLGAWLTTVLSRVCLNMLRARRTRREEPLETHVPDPIVVPAGDPAHEAELADSVALALLVVLETLTPAERLAFVLHDLFAMPFGEIAPLVERSPEAARQLASRARRRVRGSAPSPDRDPARQRELVEAFMAAARDGDFDRLVATLDPAVVLRADAGPASHRVVGAEAVARRALLFSRMQGAGIAARAATINGAAGVVSFRDGHPASIFAATVVGGRIAAIDIIADPERLAGLDLSAF
jgi:RNA polymerase sigma-70 factor (ECF subfamily)